jgi:hypothetical protein
MNREREFVVDPLVLWFRGQRANWQLDMPGYDVSATGWDIEAHRKNQDLLIEAKYIEGPFLASFSGLVTSPLANRPDQHLKRKYRSWSYGVCWAIGSSRPLTHIYQILLDYFCRNPVFWKHYMEDLHMKSIFFIDNKKVAQIPFTKFLEISKPYGIIAPKNSLRKRRAIAEKLLAKLVFAPPLP